MPPGFSGKPSSPLHTRNGTADIVITQPRVLDQISKESARLVARNQSSRSTPKNHVVEGSRNSEVWRDFLTKPKRKQTLKGKDQQTELQGL
jgi:hypothetical protein